MKFTYSIDINISFILFVPSNLNIQHSFFIIELSLFCYWSHNAMIDRYYVKRNKDAYKHYNKEYKRKDNGESVTNSLSPIPLQSLENLNTYKEFHKKHVYIRDVVKTGSFSEYPKSIYNDINNDYTTDRILQ